MPNAGIISRERKRFHSSVIDLLSAGNSGIPGNADSSNALSIAVSKKIAEQLKAGTGGGKLAGQTSGSKFEEYCCNFINATFPSLTHLRPGSWQVLHVGGRKRNEIARFAQYEHLSMLDTMVQSNPELAAALGSDYTISPDVVVTRSPEPDSLINASERIVDELTGTRADVRLVAGSKPILHASVSCKWTIRSDRAQNSRSEAFNLIRNRKGHTPHIMVITGEPLPSRIASIALGTGDIDCTYHFALYELQTAIDSTGNSEAIDLLSTMVEGKRLKDISDLPLDLAI